MKLLKKIGIALVVLILIGVVFGGGSGEKNSSSDSSKKEEAAATQESEEKVDSKGKNEAAAETEQEAAESEEEAEDDGPQMATDSKYTVTINDHRIVEDYDGAPCIAIDYTFTNVSDDSPTSMMMATNISIYQNGVECEDAYFSGENSDGYTNKIKAGASVEVTRSYKLQDTTSDVEVEVGQNSFWDDALLAYEVITLS